MSDKCPKCGAAHIHGTVAFDCGSMDWVPGAPFHQSEKCLFLERDQLAEQVNRLREEVGKAYDEGAKSECRRDWESSRAKRISEGGE